VTATLNPGAEAMRIDRSYMPLLLQLKMTGAAGPGPASAVALERLEAGELLVDGRLHPTADAVLELVAAPRLVVSVERLRGGRVSATTIWATPDGAVLGGRVDGGLFELRLVTTALLPFHLLQLIHIRPLPLAEETAVTVRASVLYEAESRLEQADVSGAGDVFARNGVADVGRLLSLLDARIASWRIHSLWSSKGGIVNAKAHGMDCGPVGNILVSIEGAEPMFSLRPATFHEVTKAVRATLPGGAEPLE